MAAIVSAMSEDVAGRMVAFAGPQTPAAPARPGSGQTDAREEDARASLFATLIGRSRGDGPPPRPRVDGGHKAVAAGGEDGVEGVLAAPPAPWPPDTGHLPEEAELSEGGVFAPHLGGQDDPPAAGAALAGADLGNARAGEVDGLPDTPPDRVRQGSGVHDIAAAAQNGDETAGDGSRGAEGPPAAWRRTDADGVPLDGWVIAAPERAGRDNDRVHAQPADQPFGRGGAGPERQARAALVARLAAPEAGESRVASTAQTAPTRAGRPEGTAGAAPGAGTGPTVGHAGEPPSEVARAPTQRAGENVSIEADQSGRHPPPESQHVAARGAAVVAHGPHAGWSAEGSPSPVPVRSGGETVPPAFPRDGRAASAGLAPEPGDRRTGGERPPPPTGHGSAFGQTGGAGGQGARGSAPLRPVPEGAHDGQPGPAGRAAEVPFTPARSATEPPAPADRPAGAKLMPAPDPAAPPAVASTSPMAPEAGVLPSGGGAGPGGAETSPAAGGSGEGLSPGPEPRAPAPPQPPAVPQAAPRTDNAANAAAQIIAALTQPEDGPVEVRLSPEELGRVRLFMSGGEGGMNVHLQADRGETLDLLRRNVSMLADELRQAGYDALSFSFGDGREDAPAPQTRAPVAPPDPEADGDAGAGPAAPPRRPGEEAGLDLRL